MFILRTIDQSQVVANKAIGNYYDFITKDASEKEYKEVYASYFENQDKPKNEPYAFICSGDSEKCYTNALYKGWKYYMMTENGKTFENLNV